ncbi:MAG TPA: L,D-transpeptidase [Beijerinckiaceae bacterium]|nr:L,D-transpeptidase [Beijerinckiaceae bacterium]
MNGLRMIAAAVVALSLAGCKYETFADPTLKGRDLELMALAPPMPSDLDPIRARYRIHNPTGEKTPGTIVVDSDAKFLYLIEENGMALRYPIAVGQDAYVWSGTAIIGRKAEWPNWTPGNDARALNPGLPGTVPGGPQNPLGARAIYLYDNGKDTMYRIHGTNEPESIGRNQSLGCIRMYNIDVIDLYNRVKDGAKVVVL